MHDETDERAIEQETLSAEHRWLLLFNVRSDLLCTFQRRWRAVSLWLVDRGWAQTKMLRLDVYCISTWFDVSEALANYLCDATGTVWVDNLQLCRRSPLSQVVPLPLVPIELTFVPQCFVILYLSSSDLVVIYH